MKVKSTPGPLLAPLPSVMVSCGNMEESNILTIAWTGIINSNPPMTYISVQPKRYSHDMFMAEITAVHVDEKYVDEKGAYDFGAMDLVAFNHGKYYRLKAEELGFFGFSVMKPKTAKRKAAEKAQRKRK